MTFPILATVRKTASIAVVVLIVLSTIFMTFMVLPGDPYFSILPRGPVQELEDRIVEEMRLDQPLYVQYSDYIVDTLTGDFRVSTAVRTGADIQDFIWNAAGNTIALLSLGLVGSLIIAVGLEAIIYRRHGRVAPLVIHSISLGLLAIPAFALALVMLNVNVWLDLGFPLRGSAPWHSSNESVTILDVAQYAVLPALTTVMSSIGLAILLLREAARRSAESNESASALERIASGVVRLRPFIHFYVAWTMTIALAVDIMFSYDGLGKLLWDAINHLDIPVLMATLFLIWMIVLAASMIVSMAMHALAGSRSSEVLGDWCRRDPQLNDKTPLRAREGVPWGVWLGRIWGAFRGSASGMTALILMVALAVVGVLAPVLATVPDPTNVSSYEPSVMVDEWVNPLPPSLEPSQYTGMTHPLGTDSIGRDLYSMWLYAARGAILTTAILTLCAVLIGLVVGLIAAKTVDISGMPGRFADFFLTVGARAIVTVPIIAYIGARMTAVDAHSLSMALPLLVFLFYGWAWMLIFRPVRKTAAASSKAATTYWMVPSIVAETLSVAKFAVPLLFVVYMSLPYQTGTYLPTEINWGGMLFAAWMYEFILTDYWYMIIPPIVGICAVAGSTFVMLDRCEMTVRKTHGYPSPATTTHVPGPVIQNPQQDGQ